MRGALRNYWTAYYHLRRVTLYDFAKQQEMSDEREAITNLDIAQRRPYRLFHDCATAYYYYYFYTTRLTGRGWSRTR